MAHTHQYVEKALTYDKIQAEYAMAMFQKLYFLEREAREQGMTPEERRAFRLDESLPLMNELGKWMMKTHKSTNPKSPLGTAAA